MPLANPSDFFKKASGAVTTTHLTTHPAPLPTTNPIRMATEGPKLTWPNSPATSTANTTSHPLPNVGLENYPALEPMRPSGSSSVVTTIHTNGTHQIDGGSSTPNQMNVLSQLYALEHMFATEMKDLKSEIVSLKAKMHGTPNGATTTHHEGSANGISITKSLTEPPTSTLPSPTTELPLNLSLYIRNLTPLSNPLLRSTLPPPGTQLETFPLSFLTSFLGGKEHSPGLWYNATGTTGLKKTWKGKTYYVVDAGVEPYLPLQPGAHGAKLSVVFNGFEDEKDAGKMYSAVPLFVCTAATQDETGEKKYTYFGNYSQNRWSDKLDCDRVQEVVPEKVQRFWAEKLADRERPEWVTKALMEHFWPRPGFEGELLGRQGVLSEEKRKEVEEDVKSYIEELVEWEEEAKMKVGLLKVENIMEAFEKVGNPFFFVSSLTKQ